MTENYGVQTSKDELQRAVSARLREHVDRLAEPKKNRSVPQEEPTEKAAKKSALKYKATKRILMLAKPKYVTTKKIDREVMDPVTTSINSVSPSALLYKPTKRILELAQPK